MSDRRAVLLAALSATFVFSLPHVATAAEDAKKPRMLLLTQSKGFTHGVVRRKGSELSQVEKTVKNWADSSGLFEVDCSQDAAKDFTKANLAKYDVVMFYTTGKLPIAQDALDYFFGEWLKTKGHGFLGVHSATDTFKNYEPYWDMVGGTFAGHPWGSGDTVTIAVHDAEHPAMKPFGKEFTIRDEIYQYRNFQPKKVRVLASLDMTKTKKKTPYHVPVSWAKNYGDGRMFYTNLGHNGSTWQNPQFEESMINAIRWLLGQADGSGHPNPEVSAEHHEASEAAAKR
ncbi:MAG: ThuA domain-containing protein [Pirellulales bacterium]|nr:ThuA domain-containing protein [Pirellulales bacterium]